MYEGKAVQVRHVRNGTELPYIDKNMNYDFDFQVDYERVMHEYCIR